MATVTEPKRTARGNLSEASRKVRDPLRRLRVYIRTYVITESMTFLVISLAFLFWLGVALDYGVFKLFGVDWVATLPRWMRSVLLGGGVLATLYFVEIRKLLRKPDPLAAAAAPAGGPVASTPITAPKLRGARV